MSVVYELELGVTYVLTLTPSKNTYSLVLGKNPCPTKLIVLGLTKGISALADNSRSL